MNNVRKFFLCLLLAGCASTGGDTSGQSKRLVFVPDATASPEVEYGNGPFWTALAPSSIPGKDPQLREAMGWAGLGEKFPVREKDGPILFEVLVQDGNDEGLSLEILSESGSTPVEVQREKPVHVDVAGVQYKISYPTLSVAATEEKSITNQAMLIVSTRRE